ncbi:hypothetical protein TK50_03695 [Micromonospora haikouensis]|uniref:Uncharacterized protein n=1 Tax=Micromonospora haikouensis TaxID=686309 RepID=A0A0D0X1E3_9ACTN|nr:hypothetical protein TK50_03695 [Micromonospora haikouensis]
MGFPDPESREAAKNSHFLDELDRQAELAIRSIHFAVMRGRETRDARDPKVWGSLQNALFAAICIARIFNPKVRKYPGMTKDESQAYADRRGKTLRDLLQVKDDCHILEVNSVRDAYEHYDEYFEKHLLNGVDCFSDWYITDRLVLKTASHPGGSWSSAGLRVFYPAGGVLIFDERRLYLFELEVELIELRVRIADKLKELRESIKGRANYGGHIGEVVMTGQETSQRFMEWQHRRAEALEELAKRKR